MAKKLVKYYVADAFTERAFNGNPAAVCLLEEDRDDEWLQAVAAEFNLPLTCYLTRINDSVTNPRFNLRWFTPVIEVELCGHATLAASHVLFSTGLVKSNVIQYHTLSGTLTAKKHPENSQSQDVRESTQKCFYVELDFPSRQTLEHSSADLDTISKALNGVPILDIKRTERTESTYHDLFVVFPSGEAVAEFEPSMDEIEKCPERGIIITGVAPSGSGFDFYSRFFYPKLGLGEDQVCGSAHCSLATYWSKKLGKSDLTAYAASRRGGSLKIHLDEKNKRVLLRGRAVTVMEGSLLV